MDMYGYKNPNKPYRIHQIHQVSSVRKKKEKPRAFDIPRGPHLFTLGSLLELCLRCPEPGARHMANDTFSRYRQRYTYNHVHVSMKKNICKSTNITYIAIDYIII
jgi:hypothetical protein